MDETPISKSSKIRISASIFFGLLLFRIIYILLESQYHQSILTLTSSPGLTRPQLEALNQQGHNLAAIGLTLLLFPSFLLLSRRLPKFALRFALTSFLCIASIFSIHRSLEYTVDAIVDFNMEKAYEAYYISIFKYGTLNNIFTYDSYISTDHIRSDTLTLADRLIASNSFLMTITDPGLIQRLIKVGIHHFIDIQIEMNPDDYDIAKKKFHSTITKLTTAFNQLKESRNKLKMDLSAAESKQYERYKELLTKTDDAWNRYQQAHKDAQQHFLDETTAQKIDRRYSELRRFFIYRKFQRAKDQYNKSMQENFGHYIKPESWCISDKCPAREKIPQVIKSEIQDALTKQTAPIPINLSANQFRNHPQTIKSISQKSGLSLPDDFDYSLQAYNKAYQQALIKQRDDGITKIRRTLTDNGFHNMNIGIGWKEFTNHPSIRQNFQRLYPEMSDKVYSSIHKMLTNGDISRFREEVYTPILTPNIQNQLYQKQDFKNNLHARELGRESIKVLYIPPFALSLSMISLLLNITSIFGMLASLILLGKKRFTTPAITIFVIILATLPLIGTFRINNPIVTSLKNTPSANYYLQFMEWMAFYQNLNYYFQNTISPLQKPLNTITFALNSSIQLVNHAVSGIQSEKETTDEPLHNSVNKHHNYRTFRMQPDNSKTTKRYQ